MSPSRPSVTLGKAPLLLITAFLLPSFGVIVARFGLPIPGPASAAAAETSGVTLPQAARTGVQAPQRLAMMRAFQEEAAKPFSSSPMLSRFAELPPTAPASPAFVPAFPSSEGRPSGMVPALSLSSIMGSGERSIAVINGKLCRVGDRVVDGWTVTAIHQQAGGVTLSSESGEELALSMQPKGLRPR